jgi:hypothetical protein
MADESSDLKTQLLLAAFDCSDGNISKNFTFEELLVKAWENNPFSWGLRGFEDKHPDSERIHRELDSRGRTNKGLVDLGLLEKVRTRVYRLSTKGLSEASRAKPEHKGLRERAARRMEDDIRRILEHGCFRQWLADPRKPDRFREAGSFWGVAPGTPSKVIRQRIQKIEDTLMEALRLLDRKDVDRVAAGRGGRLFDRTDIERCLEFDRTLRLRFANDLRTLGVDLGNESPVPRN